MFILLIKVAAYIRDHWDRSSRLENPFKNYLILRYIYRIHRIIFAPPIDLTASHNCRAIIDAPERKFQAHLLSPFRLRHGPRARRLARALFDLLQEAARGKLQEGSFILHSSSCCWLTMLCASDGGRGVINWTAKDPLGTSCLVATAA